MIKDGQYSIVPKGHKYIVTRRLWWLPFETEYLGSTFGFDHYNSPFEFSTIENAQNAIFYAIRDEAVNIMKRRRAKRIQNSRKTVNVPPWINP